MKLQYLLLILIFFSFTTFDNDRNVSGKILSPKSDIVISENVIYDYIEIPKGITLRIENDISIMSRSDIVIDGSVICLPFKRGEKSLNGIRQIISTETLRMKKHAGRECCATWKIWFTNFQMTSKPKPSSPPGSGSFHTSPRRFQSAAMRRLTRSFSKCSRRHRCIRFITIASISGTPPGGSGL